MDGFELFSRRRGRVATSEPMVAVSKNGAITLNSAAVGLFDDSPEAVQLLFNPIKRSVALRGASDDAPNAYRLRHPTGSGTRSVGARVFFDYYGIDFEERQSYPAYAVDNCVVFDLSASDQQAAPRRKRRTREQILADEA